MTLNLGFPKKHGLDGWPKTMGLAGKVEKCLFIMQEATGTVLILNTFLHESKPLFCFEGITFKLGDLIEMMESSNFLPTCLLGDV